MKYITRGAHVLVYVLIVSTFAACSGKENVRNLDKEGIVPIPVSVNIQEGKFLFNKQTTWNVDSEPAKQAATKMATFLSLPTGFAPVVTEQDENAAICLLTVDSLKSEAYNLHITPSKIIIEASDAKGFFYATQTLRQLLPAEVESRELKTGIEWSVPSLTIHDHPRFEYRGLMLDASRFFIPKETVLKLIDCMGLLKVNKLHLHLVDDNGWRLEIKKYPKLTEVGAWRVSREEPFSGRRNPQKGESTPTGGFYTQAAIKEIVQYALDREIEVIPEIEMPAHTNSSLAAYPSLACPTVTGYIGVLPGLGGRNSEIIYCAGNDSVFTFLEDVIDEVVTLFPSQYIHLGGDEATKTHWKICPKCQARMKQEGLKHEEDLQGYFMKRMSDYVKSKGKKVMGWDELTNSTIPEEAIIFGWQGFGSTALKAAKLGHQFVMTPARIMYLIRYQGPQWFEPRTYFGNNTLQNVYDYEPVQPEWSEQEKSLLMGVQASLWTEFCNTKEEVEYLVLPRLAALAEVAWSGPDKKMWTSFLLRLDSFNEHLDVMGINYAKSMFNLDHSVCPSTDKVKVALSCIRPDMEIRYTTDGTEPTAGSQLYSDSLLLAKSTVVKAATFAGREQKGMTLVLPIEWNKATAKPITGNNGKLYLLNNGLKGSDKHTDFEWCGWYGEDGSFVIDLETSESIERIEVGTITNYGMAVHIPSSIKFLISEDNINFAPVGQLDYTKQEVFKEGIYLDTKTLKTAVKGRYLKVQLTNPGLCPTDHVRPEQKSWMYIDEVKVY